MKRVEAAGRRMESKLEPSLLKDTRGVMALSRLPTSNLDPSRLYFQCRSTTGRPTLTEIQVTARLKIHDGQLDPFKAAARDCLASVLENDQGTLQYDWFFSDEASECVVRERYPDSVAVLDHMANLGEILQSLLALLHRLRADVLLGNSLLNDKHPSLKADFMIATRPANLDGRKTDRISSDDLPLRVGGHQEDGGAGLREGHLHN